MEEETLESIVPEVVDESKEELLTGDVPILSTEAMQFAKLIADGRGPTEAYREIFPEKAGRTKWVSRAAYALAHNTKVREQITIIQEATRLQIVMEAPAAFERVKQLSESAKGEKVRLDANIEILDRAGLKPPQRVEQIQIGLWGSLSTEDMRNLVKRRIENK
jgi:hypothetical protein